MISFKVTRKLNATLF